MQRAPCTAALAVWGRARSTVGWSGARDVSVRTLDAFDKRFESFLDEATAAWEIIPLRSLEYLNWRFCDPRAGTFTIRAAEAGGDLVGYAVLHVSARAAASSICSRSLGAST